MRFKFLVVVFVIAYLSVQAQTDSTKAKTDSTVIAPATPPPANETRRDNRPFKERIAFGFGSSFWFNANTSYIELCPVIAYRFPKRLITGVGYRYIYRRDRFYGVDLNSYGPDFFARLQLLRMVYLWSEYEILNNQYIAQVVGNDINKETTTTEALFAGLGFIKSLGKRGRGGLSVQVLYNFLYERDDINPYYSPVTYRVGYYF